MVDLCSLLKRQTLVDSIESLIKLLLYICWENKAYVNNYCFLFTHIYQGCPHFGSHGTHFPGFAECICKETCQEVNRAFWEVPQGQS